MASGGLIDADARAVDTSPQRVVTDAVQWLYFEALRQRQLIQFASDHLGFERRHVARDRQIDVRVLRMRALGAIAKQDRSQNLRMPPENVADKSQFMIREVRAVHAFFLLASRSRTCRRAVKYQV